MQIAVIIGFDTKKSVTIYQSNSTKGIIKIKVKQIIVFL